MSKSTVLIGNSINRKVAKLHRIRMAGSKGMIGERGGVWNRYAKRPGIDGKISNQVNVGASIIGTSSQII